MVSAGDFDAYFVVASRCGRCAGPRLLTRLDNLCLIAYFCVVTATVLNRTLTITCLDDLVEELHSSKGELAESPTGSAIFTCIISLFSGVMFDVAELYWDSCFGPKSWFRGRSSHLLLGMMSIGLGISGIAVPLTFPSFKAFFAWQLVATLFATISKLYCVTLAVRVSDRAEQGLNGRGGAVRHGIKLGSRIGTCVTFVELGFAAAIFLSAILVNCMTAIGRKRTDSFYYAGWLAIVLGVLILFLEPPPPTGKAADADGKTKKNPSGPKHSVEAEEPLVAKTYPRFSVVAFCVFLLATGVADGHLVGSFYYAVSSLHGLGLSENRASTYVGFLAMGSIVSRVVLTVVGRFLTPAVVLTSTLIISGVCSFAVYLLVKEIDRQGPSIWEQHSVVMMFLLINTGAALGDTAANSWLFALYSAVQPISGSLNGTVSVSAALGFVVMLNVYGRVIDNYGVVAFQLCKVLVAWISAFFCFWLCCLIRNMVRRHEANGSGKPADKLQEPLVR